MSPSDFTVKLLANLSLILLFSLSSVKAEVDNYGNAQMLAMKAKALVGHQQTSTPPGHFTDRQKARRGGPYVAHTNNEAGCGGIAIGNVRPLAGDHRSHQTTVIIQGHIINTGNRC